MGVTTRSSSRNRAAKVQRVGIQQVDTKRRPLLRGWLHASSIPLMIPSVIYLMQNAPTYPIKCACLTYIVFLGLQLTVSGTYNIPTWDPETRLMLRKLDHAVIYLLIAATYTPFCVIGSETYPQAWLLLQFIWIVSLIGFAMSLIKKDGFKSKAVSSAIYILIGWCGTPAFIYGIFSNSVLHYLLLGGLSYSIGGIMYALHWPNPVKGILEYHEMLHLATITANVMMYKAILQAM